MSEHSLDFLKYIYTEELYRIPDHTDMTTVSTVADVVNVTLVAPVATPIPTPVPLVVTTAAPTPAPVVAQVSMHTAAPDPKKQVLILFENRGARQLNIPDEQYLTKILAACKLKLEDVDLGNLATEHGKAIRDYKIVIAFTPNHGMGDMAPYQMHQIASTQFVPADALATIVASTDLRKKLWTTLQPMFEV